MSNQVIFWLKVESENWQRTVDQMEQGRMKTSAIEDGVTIDTTERTITTFKSWIVNANQLIQAHELRANKPALS
ncbi:MAG: hypothetical protein AAF642_01195 [Pseudomonadota bacterium]